MDFDSKIPIYLQLRDDLQSRILSGELPPGASMTSARIIANQAKINANTVQHAMNSLIQEGLVESHRGKGYFVIKDKEKIITQRQKTTQVTTHKFLYTMERLGLDREQIIEIVIKTLMESIIHFLRTKLYPR